MPTWRRWATRFAAVMFLAPAAPGQPDCAPAQYAAQVGPVNAPVLEFNGSTTFVDLGDPPELNIVGLITIEAWIRSDMMFGAHNIITRGPGTLAGSEVSLRLDNNAYEVVSYNGSATFGCQSTSTFAADQGRWVHVAATWDGTGWKLFRNGQVIASNSNPNGAVFAPGGWRIGTWSEDTGTPVRWFLGGIAEVRLWSIARSPAQIQSSMFEDVTGEPGLAGYWKLNDGSGLLARDAAGLDLHGVLVNGPAWRRVWRDEDADGVLDACQSPLFALHPAPFSGCDGAPVILAAAAGGAASAGIAYQWQRDGADIPGATGSTLVLDHPTPLDDGEYRCLAANALNPALVAASNPAAVQVDASLSLGLGWGRDDSGQSFVPPRPAAVTYTAFAAGSRHSLALRSDGTIAAWGDNTEGQTDVPPLESGVVYTAVAAGEAFSLALRSDGTIAAWGDNAEGQTSVPPLPMGLAYTSIAAGFSHALAVRSDGVVSAWGSNAFGQLNAPPPPVGVTYTAVAAGWLHSLALRSDGRVAAWGNNGFGQLNVPALPPLRTYLAASAGAAHSIALRSDGRLIAWGLNDAGQASPPMPTPGAPFASIACGAFHTLALDALGGVTAFGENEQGQSLVPPLAPGTRYTIIGAGCAAEHTLAARRIDWSGPADQTVEAGQAASFAVTIPLAGGSGFRWRRGGIELFDGPTGWGSTISGAATPALAITNARMPDSGAYDLLVGGPCDALATPPAMLAVLDNCPGDADGDRAVGLPDIAVLITHWTLAVPPAPAHADLDGSGDIGLGDIAEVIGRWGASCP